jgi:hypothetical protein
MDNYTSSNPDYCAKENLVNPWTSDDDKQSQQQPAFTKAYTQAFVNTWSPDDEKQQQQAFTKAYTQEALVKAWAAADAKAEKAAAELETKKTSLAFVRDVVRIVADSLVSAFAIFGIMVVLHGYRQSRA